MENIKTIKQTLLGWKICGARRIRKIIPNIVDTSFCSNTQGQHKQYALTKKKLQQGSALTLLRPKERKKKNKLDWAWQYKNIKKGPPGSKYFFKPHILFVCDLNLPAKFHNPITRSWRKECLVEKKRKKKYNKLGLSCAKLISSWYWLATQLNYLLNCFTCLTA